MAATGGDRDSEPTPRSRVSGEAAGRPVGGTPGRDQPDQRGDVAALLRYAVHADPASEQGRAALESAKAAALRLGRDLRRQARVVGGRRGAEMERRAKEAFFQAVVAEQLPRFGGKLGDLVGRPTTPKPTPPPQPAPLTAPDAPTGVTAEAGIASATVRWQAPAQLVTSYTVTPYLDAAPQTATPVAGTRQDTTVLGLTPGASYRFTVAASNLIDTSPESDLSNEVTPAELPVGTEAPIELDLPSFSSDPVLLIDSAAEPARQVLAAARESGAKWRYEHLKTQAIAAAKDTMQFEQHIASIMAMALEKLGTAEELLGDTLLEAAAALQGAGQQIAEAAAAPEIDDIIDDLGDLAAESLLLPRFLAWLIEVGPVNFWVGLFEAVINDLASVVPLFGDATDFGRTKKYLGEAFDDDRDGVKTALRDAAQGVIDRLDADVGEMIAPLRAAVGQVVAGTRKAMADAFEASDLVLLMTPAETPGAPSVPDLDPFRDLYEQLEAQVDELAEQIKERIRGALQPLIDGGSDLFTALVVTFLVIPLLAFLVIALAGGPFSAALLAAIVLVAAEELIRLLVRWLSGPLLRRVDEVKRQVVELVAQLQGFFAQQAGLVRNESPEVLLRVLASQLRQVSDFLPQTFLEETAAVLEEARNVVLRTATELGLAAEQAVGMENATAFDAVKLDYATHLTPAPQLPGGRDPARLAGAALLRDLGRLEEQRTGLRDGKELVFTHRLSLLRLLGDDPAQFEQFRQAREIVIELDQAELLDRTFPGVYRALIQEVDLVGVIATPLAGGLRGIAVTLTHLGESRTRIKPSANPAAPPLALPDCFPRSADEFATAVVGDPALRAQLSRAFNTFELGTIGDYALAFLFAALFGHPDPAEAITGQFKRACRDHLPAALGRATVDASCGLVDQEVLEEGARRRIHALRFADALAQVLIPPDAIDRLFEQPNLEPGIAGLVDLLQADVVQNQIVVVPGLERVAREAYEGTVVAFHPHIAKWGGATLEEDPDPQVRALGYATLVRNMPQETAVFNLFAEAPSLNVRADPARPQLAVVPLAPVQALQYRPFENRGLGGKLLLRLEAIGDDGTAEQLSESLTDLFVDVTIRACFDSDLAQTVRASRRQALTGLSVVDDLAGAVSIALPGSIGSLKAGTSELRTVHYSLRAHRDKTLQTWAAAVQAAPTVTSTLAALLAGKAPLGRDTPFTPLDNFTSFTLELTDSAPDTSEGWLVALAQTIRVTPQDLGFASAVLSGREVLEDAQLVSLGIAVIPTPEGVRGETDELTADPMTVQLRVPPPLNALLPGYDPAAALPERLRLAINVSDPPSLNDLFGATTNPVVEVTFGEDVFDAERLYDVMLSMTFRVPVLETATAAAALV